MGKKKLHSVLTDDLEHCIITGMSPVQIHHIFYGTANRRLSEEDGFIIPLIPMKHTDSRFGIHFDKKLDTEWKQIAQKYYEDNLGTREDFIHRYGRSYL